MGLGITEYVCEAGAAVQVTEEIGFEVEHFQVDIHLIKKRIARPLGHRLRERYQNFENEGFSKFSIFPSPEEREYRERWSPSWLRGDGENRKKAMNSR